MEPSMNSKVTHESNTLSPLCLWSEFMMSMQRAFHVVDTIYNVKQKLCKQIREVLIWDFELEIALHKSWKLSNLNQFETQKWRKKKTNALKMIGLNERK